MRGRREASHGSSDLFTNLIFSREHGSSRSTRFARRFSASLGLIERIDLYARLEGHEGCVNTVEFISTGDAVVSGSDDRKVAFWDWSRKEKILSYDSGHPDNIFQAKTMPFTDDRSIVTSCAEGQVRLGQILESGRVETKCLGCHEDSVHQLAVVPGSSHVLYSCGQDGFVQRYDLRCNSTVQLFRCCSSGNNRQFSNYIGLNAIVINPKVPSCIALGGSDAYVRVYDLRSCQRGTSSSLDKPVNLFCPPHLIDSTTAHITGLAYSKSSELLASYADESIYLFQGTCQENGVPQMYMGHGNKKTIKGVSLFGSHDEYVMSGSDCGRIFIWRKKDAKLVRVMVGDEDIVNQIVSHPHMPFFASCGLDHDIKVWSPIGTKICPVPDDIEEIMEANNKERQGSSSFDLDPSVIRHLMRLQRRQILEFGERGYNAGFESDDEEIEAYLLGLASGNSSGHGTMSSIVGQTDFRAELEDL